MGSSGFTVFQRCTNQLVIEGTEDWIQAAEVVSWAITVGGAQSDAERRELALAMTRHVVVEGLMRLGDVNALGDPNLPRGFTPWPLEPEEAFAEAERRWELLGRNPDLWELFWLENTDKGNALAEDLVRRRNAGELVAEDWPPTD